MRKRYILAAVTAALVILCALVARDNFNAQSGIDAGLFKKAASAEPLSPEEGRAFSSDFARAVGRKDLGDAGRLVKILPGRFIRAKETDYAVVMSFGDRLSYAAVCGYSGGKYRFLACVDSFFAITGAEAVHLPDGRDLFVAREYVDQREGAFEESSYLRAYYYDGGVFRMVLSVLCDYDCYWNEAWTDTALPYWLRVSQTVEKSFDSETLSLSVTKKQKFAVSGDGGQDKPDDGGFNTITSRNVTQVFRWSDKWKQFVLFEVMNADTGETAAVIQDISGESPFELYRSTGTEVYRVKRNNGTIEVVAKTVWERR